MQFASRPKLSSIFFAEPVAKRHLAVVASWLNLGAEKLRARKYAKDVVHTGPPSLGSRPPYCLNHVGSTSSGGEDVGSGDGVTKSL